MKCHTDRRKSARAFVAASHSNGTIRCCRSVCQAVEAAAPCRVACVRIVGATSDRARWPWSPTCAQAGRSRAPGVQRALPPRTAGARARPGHPTPTRPVQPPWIFHGGQDQCSAPGPSCLAHQPRSALEQREPEGRRLAKLGQDPCNVARWCRRRDGKGGRRAGRCPRRAARIAKRGEDPCNVARWCPRRDGSGGRPSGRIPRRAARITKLGRDPCNVARWCSWRDGKGGRPSGRIPRRAARIAKLGRDPCNVARCRGRRDGSGGCRTGRRPERAARISSPDKTHATWHGDAGGGAGRVDVGPDVVLGEGHGSPVRTRPMHRGTVVAAAGRDGANIGPNAAPSEGHGSPTRTRPIQRATVAPGAAQEAGISARPTLAHAAPSAITPP